MTGPARADSRVPVTILTGFLGSGKTTLLNYILTERHGHRIAVIMNEFGEIDIDSDLIVETKEEIYQMTNGCICCIADVRQDLVDILGKLLTGDARLDHIIVETSGLADPKPVAAAFFLDHAAAAKVTLDGIVTLVDAKHIGGHLEDAGLNAADNQAVDQIVAADRIVMNKIDLVSGPELVAAAARIRRINETAEIMHASHGEVELDRVLAIGGFEPPSIANRPDFFEDDHHHRHDPSLESVSFAFAQRFDRDKLGAFIRTLLDERGGDIFRLKGIVAVEGDSRRYVLQCVHKLMDYRADVPWGRATPSSRIVLIGRNLDRAALAAGLEGCGVGSAR